MTTPAGQLIPQQAAARGPGPSSVTVSLHPRGRLSIGAIAAPASLPPRLPLPFQRSRGRAPRVRCLIVSRIRRLVFDFSEIDRLRFSQIAAGIKHAIDLGAVLGPLLNLVEIAVVRNQRL